MLASSPALRPIGFRLSMFSIQTKAPNSRHSREIVDRIRMKNNRPSTRHDLGSILAPASLPASLQIGWETRIGKDVNLKSLRSRERNCLEKGIELILAKEADNSTACTFLCLHSQPSQLP